MKYLATLLLLTVYFTGQSQQGNIQIFGKIQKEEIVSKREKKRNLLSPKPLKEVTITIKDNSQILESFNTEDKSMYELFLSPDVSYQIEFSKENFTTKIIEINTHGMTEEFISKGYELITDIALFKSNGTSEIAAYSKLPVAICNFNKRRNVLEWDMNYAQNAFRTFVDLMESSGEKEKSILRDKVPENEINYEEEIQFINLMDKRIDQSSSWVRNLYTHLKFHTIQRLEKEVEPSASY